MKIANTIPVIIVLTITFSCVSLPNLPESTAIGLYERGAHIRLTTKNSLSMQGELIAVESGEVLLVEEGKSTMTVLKQSEVKKLRVYNARPKHYGWSIPASAAITGLHGWFLIATLPLNLLVTVPVTIGGERAFSFSQNNASYHQLKMYARFPQGIPTLIDRNTIH